MIVSFTVMTIDVERGDWNGRGAARVKTARY